MSKAVKELELQAMRASFGNVRDLVLLSISGLNSLGTATLRSNLRKKKIRLQVVKNTLARRVLQEGGIDIPKESPVWTGPLALVWGQGSIAEVSREVEAELKNPKFEKLYKAGVKLKGAVADGESISFDEAVKMPTREEAVAGVLAAILGPAGAIAGCLTGPVSQVASQIQQIAEKAEDEAPTEAPAA